MKRVFLIGPLKVDTEILELYAEKEKELKANGYQVFSPIKAYPEIYRDPDQYKEALANIFEELLNCTDIYVLPGEFGDMCNGGKILMFTASVYGLGWVKAPPDLPKGEE